MPAAPTIPTHVVATPTAFVYARPGEPASVATQLRHGDAVFHEGTPEHEADVSGVPWVRVFGGALGHDDGWVSRHELIAHADAYGGIAQQDASSTKDLRGLVVSSLVAQVYAVASRKAGPWVAELPGESTLCALERTEGDAASPLDHNPWWRVVLADGREGWVQGGDVAEGALPPLQTGQEHVAEAERLLGRPYVWGGSCTFGLDCSGLTALLARRSASRVILPHSAKRQLRETWPSLERVGDDRTIDQLADAPRGDEAKPGSAGWQHAQDARRRYEALLEPGDFVYFAMSAGNPDAERRRVDHVGVYAGLNRDGDAELIHASSAGVPCTKRETLWFTRDTDTSPRTALAMRLLGVRRVG